jgi:hypothetical protein
MSVEIERAKLRYKRLRDYMSDNFDRVPCDPSPWVSFYDAASSAIFAVILESELQNSVARKSFEKERDKLKAEIRAARDGD